MNILVFGAGAVGRYLGGYLAHAGHRVVLVTRSGADHINKNGLNIHRPNRPDEGPILVKPEALPDFSGAMAYASDNEFTFDHILLAMKSYDVEAAVAEIAKMSIEVPHIITMQNGIDAEKPVVELVGKSGLTAGSLTTPVSFDAHGDIVEERANRGVAFASPDGSDRYLQIVELFQSAGVEALGVSDYESLKWSKALVNMVGNATSAILDMPPGEIYQNRGTYQIEKRALLEAIVVMEAKGIEIINLPGSSSKTLAAVLKWLPDFILKPILTRQVSRGRGDKMPSFNLDLASGKLKSEVVFHNGAVAQHGGKMGVATPVNAALAELLTDIASGKWDWGEFKGRPDALVQRMG